MCCLALRLSNRSSRGILEAKKRADNRLRRWLCLWGFQVSNSDVCNCNVQPPLLSAAPKKVVLKEVAGVCSLS